MSSAGVISTFFTSRPLISIPRMARAWLSASSAFEASFTPPAFPLPPEWTCAFTTTRPPNFRAIASASSGVLGHLSRGHGDTSLPEDLLGLELVDIHRDPLAIRIRVTS